MEIQYFPYLLEMTVAMNCYFQSISFFNVQRFEALYFILPIYWNPCHLATTELESVSRLVLIESRNWLE